MILLINTHGWMHRGSNRNKLEITPQISTVATNVINIMIPNMADTSKDEMLWAEEYATSQLRRSITRTVNKFLLA